MIWFNSVKLRNLGNNLQFQGRQNGCLLTLLRCTKTPHTIFYNDASRAEAWSKCSCQSQVITDDCSHFVSPNKAYAIIARDGTEFPYHARHTNRRTLSLWHSAFWSTDGAQAGAGVSFALGEDG